MKSFQSEADMLIHIVRDTTPLIQRLTGDFSVFFEVQSAIGIPDIVLIAFNYDEIKNRARSGLAPVTDSANVSVLTALNWMSSHPQVNKGRNTETLAALTGLSRSYVSGVLRRLEAAGYAERLGRSQWIASYPFNPLAHYVISVETKRVDWRTGLWQAHRQAADYTWLVMDVARSRSTVARADKFSRYKVGLATLSVTSELKVIVPAIVRRPSTVHRNLLIERAANLFLSGRTSGPVNPVFGRQLGPTTGADPRLQGVGAR